MGTSGLGGFVNDAYSANGLVSGLSTFSRILCADLAEQLLDQTLQQERPPVLGNFFVPGTREIAWGCNKCILRSVNSTYIGLFWRPRESQSEAWQVPTKVPCS